MKRISITLLALLLLFPVARADEGMWFLMFIKRLNGRDMQKLGLQLTPEEIYSINHNSLKDAIVQFNGGCTASIISKDGLVLTNHHCGYENIAELSTPASNHLKNGFWAKNHSEELHPKESYVRFFVRMDDVTKRMLAVVDKSMSESEREAALNREIAKIQKENDGGGKYTVSVRSFFQGNEFYYFVYQDFKDVRLVGTPPESVGKFGGDTDNWEWPRHTADFSLFRVYTNKNGEAAEYAPDNIPMQAKTYLKVSLNGVKDKDFAMIMGYPGTTNRWEASYWVDQKVKYAYPAWVEGSKTAMDAMKQFMDKDDAIRLKYASQYSQIANYWKNRQGMIDALTKYKTADTKRAAEAKFAKWANKKKNKAEYGDVLNTMANYFEKTNIKAADDNYLISIIRASALAIIPYRTVMLLRAAEKAGASPEMVRERLAEILAPYDDINIEVEKAILANTLKLYATKGTHIADEVARIKADYNGDFNRYVDEAVAGSAFKSKDNAALVTTSTSIAELEKDPLFVLSSSLLDKYRDQSPELVALNDSYKGAFRRFVEGMRVSKISAIRYPDANSTLRLTYGTVDPLATDSRNADVSKNYYTTFKTMVAKYKKDDPEFDMPQRMLDLYSSNNFGRYIDKDGSMHLNFLTNNDITGGNSGSPVMNGKGELIGLAFDGNIEAMAGDVIFDKKLQRTINVDIRYVLWVIDIYAGAKNIIDEMTIAQ
ncbi:Peptidase S46 [Capnocytophaga haemolytica]|uniref:Dipeptidyl-peptidase n=1 Tax=Capnocytophaga haemolytica TaxID=45243 RepID=A0AAX2GVP1_9FLAO|nr:S46 family peptidase [Capnocytophaga haemolytica]AMD85310.1 peptidase S46 [Capnocytophaga haemolytica]SFN61351.1 Peptidase S46 [Capnocytophaga haemolytica]SNV03190.1 V8-like Glu-specific endopeptidase [Capnocytophaga haemolytica]